MPHELSYSTAQQRLTFRKRDALAALRVRLVEREAEVAQVRGSCARLRIGIFGRWASCMPR